MAPSSLVDLLRERAHELPEERAYTFLSGGQEAETLTFAQLERRARAIAARLQKLGAAGERVLLLYPTSIDYIASFYGCLAAGAVAVPGYPPRMNHNLKRLEAILADARPKVAMTTDAVHKQLRKRFDESPALARVTWLISSEVPDEEADAWVDPNATSGTLAFLQYTSASTSAPKGVMVSHGNILHNELLAKAAVQHDRSSVIVSWLPLFHDMGLISIVLSSLYNGAPCYLLAPVDFLKKPRLWLEAISDHGGTFSGAPDFGYQLCIDRISAEEREGLDLSKWRIAFNGSEPVRAETLRNFARAFAPCGFRPEAMFPCYGLAENTLFATGRFHAAPTFFSRRGLEEHRARPEAGGVPLVSCGAPILDTKVVVADPKSLRRCAAGEIGEIWLQSPSVAQGYWNQPELSEAMFRAHLAGGDGPFLRTGDLGFLHKGELFVSGRIKDLIILRGRNLVPQDIEQIVETCDPAIRPAFVAAVSVDEGGAERLVIAAEVRREGRRELDTNALIARIRSAVAQELEVEVHAVVLLRPNSLPKTSSGKTQRALVRQQFLNGELESLGGGTPPVRPARTPARLERWLVEKIATLAHTTSERIDPDNPILMYGLDSVQVVALLGEIEDTFHLELDVERLLEGEPTLRQLVERVQTDGVRVQPKVIEPAPQRIVLKAVPNELPPPPRRDHPFLTCVNPELGRLLAQMGMDKSFVRGEGSWLWDETGRRYLDFLAQYGALPFGFNPPRIWAALNAVHQSSEPSFVQPSFLNAAGDLAKRLLAAAPPGMAYVTFANSGAEAVEAAIKLCRSTTGRHDILAAANGFHGKTLGALSATDKEKYQKPFGAPVPGFDYVAFGDAEALRRVLASRQYAAFIVEPVQGEGGIVEPPAGYLRLARKLCRDTGTLFVADEIQSGLGRTGAMFVCRELGITPDVMTVAKALGGGLIPIGACIATAAAYNDEFALKHTSTFAGNALACRAGLATLDLLEENGGALIARVAENGKRLKEGLLSLKTRYPDLIGDVRGRGYLLGLRFGLDRHSVDAGLLGYLGEQEALTALVVSHLLHVEGIRVGYTLNHGGVLRIEPPLTATWDECQYFLQALERVVVRIHKRNLAALTSQVTGYAPAVATPSRRPDRRRPAARRDADGRFAFLVHPLAWKDFAEIDSSLSVLNDTQLSALSTAIADNFDPLVVGETRVVGDNGKSAYGEFILVPRRAEELRTMSPKKAVAEILDAARLAKKRGAQIVGLGAYTSVVTQGGLSLRQDGIPPLTTGNSYTVIAARQTIKLAAEERGWTLPRRTVAVVGAGGAIGQALSVLLARDAGRLILLGNPQHPEQSRERLLQVAGRIVWSVDHLRNGHAVPAGSIASWIEELGLAAPAKPDRNALVKLGQELIRRTGSVVVDVDADSHLKEVDLIVCCTSTTERLVRNDRLGPGAVVCDVSRPTNVAAEVRSERPDVMVVDGGIVRLPGGASLGFNASVGEGNAYACMAETMMLAMERRYQDTGLGYDLVLEQVLEMERLANELGFRVALDKAKGEEELANVV
jgi:acetylornithine/succinyldiaminopimelate/putrescine aminotransferase/acyl-CoA synthetase (AMP-forming)/AMP-acid ligase II/predicted amino acid dehydrogenase/acyl carrier protein